MALYLPAPAKYDLVPMRKYALLFAVLGGAALVQTTHVCAAPKKGAPAGGKAAPACGVKLLPLVAGNSWTYEAVAAPTQMPEGMARLAPLEPRKIVITVTAIDKQGTDTVVKLEEKLSFDMAKDPKESKPIEHTFTSSITCNDKNKFDISPESFFFAGEPGGVYGLTLDKLERKKETSLKLTKGAIGEAEWIEEIAAHFTRQPAKGSESTKLVGGKLELERKFTPQQPERLATRYGTFTAEKLGILTSGRVKFDTVQTPDGKPCSIKKTDKDGKETSTPSETCELPANWISTLWLADGVGIVQTLNTYAHMYQLTEATLK